jgi:hypothetical protein
MGEHSLVKAATRPTDMPWTVVVAIVCASLIVVFWAYIALILIAVTIETGSSPLALLVEIFAVIMSIVGLVCCVRRWGRVRWAAVLQGVTIMIAFVLGARLGGLLPFPELIVVALFLAYPVLLFLPASGRWFHSTAHVTRSMSESAAGLNS